MSAKIHLILVMGVSGSGKTTIGKALAADLGWAFHDGDDFHPPSNIAKMRSGLPLDDNDRAPWLAAIRAHMESCAAKGHPAVLACSALKQSYRAILCDGLPGIGVVFLNGDPGTIRARLEARTGHFMDPGLLESQFAALEQPADALEVDIRQPEATIVGRIRSHFGI